MYLKLPLLSLGLRRELNGYFHEYDDDEFVNRQFRRKELTLRLPRYRACRVEILEVDGYPVGHEYRWLYGPLRIYEDYVNRKADIVVAKYQDTSHVISYVRLQMLLDGVRTRISQVLRRAIDDYVIHETVFAESTVPTSGGIIMGDQIVGGQGDQIVGGQKAGGDIVGRDKAGGDIVHGDKVYGDMWKQVEQQGTDAPKLAEELGILLGKLQMEAQTTDQRESLLNASRAQDAAKAGDGSKALEYLKAAGKWFFDAAAKFGLGVALASLKQKLGF